MAKITLDYHTTDSDPRRALDSLLEEIANGQEDLTFEYHDDHGEITWISLSDLTDDEPAG